MPLHHRKTVHDCQLHLLPDVTNVLLRPTHSPLRYDREPSYAHLTRREKPRKREERSALDQFTEATKLIAYHRDRDERKFRGRNRRQQKEKVEEGHEISQQPVEQVEAQCGDEVLLPCRAPKADSVDGLEWTAPTWTSTFTCTRTESRT
ncbi:hypothetical protein WMY93_014746 [Mugilogobius chulae]|uniref:Uncharacterized protein n=1 Tax=Mugilogobius chulae TaxID=88201 RepID=A0AAW0P7B3_9GOBI